MTVDVLVFGKQDLSNLVLLLLAEAKINKAEAPTDMRLIRKQGGKP